MTRVTVALSAFNEERNIQQILTDVLQQQWQKNVKLQQVIVVSDGSTDETVFRARSISDKRVIVKKCLKRRGKATRLNELFHAVDSDILVILDADVRIKQKRSLAKLIDPVLRQQADLCSMRVEEEAPENFFQQILYVSMHMKKDMYERIHNGNNLYTCHGRARAFSKQLYRAMRIPVSNNEDAYSYLFCLLHGFRYCYVKGARVYYALPRTFSDHAKQSLRFSQSQQLFGDEFKMHDVKMAYAIPPQVGVNAVISRFLKNPIEVCLYCCVQFAIKCISLRSSVTINNWEVATSSKYL